MITKRSSYSPPQRLPLSPAKAWSNKLKVVSYYGGGSDEGGGRPCNYDRTIANPNTSSEVVRLTDTGERDER